MTSLTLSIGWSNWVNTSSTTETRKAAWQTAVYAQSTRMTSLDVEDKRNMTNPQISHFYSASEPSIIRLKIKHHTTIQPTYPLSNTPLALFRSSPSNLQLTPVSLSSCAPPIFKISSHSSSSIFITSVICTHLAK
jgi:hypothetical protein